MKKERKLKNSELQSIIKRLDLLDITVSINGRFCREMSTTQCSIAP